MNKLIRILLLIATIASVCSIDRTVPDSAIMGKWVGAGKPYLKRSRLSPPMFHG